MRLHKRIPSGAGLGGGSSDAAFTLRGLNELFGLRLTDPELEMLAAELGSDTAFFIRGTPRFCEGRGEIMSQAGVDLSGRYLMIVKPQVNISTATAYAAVVPSASTAGLLERIALPVKQWPDRVSNAFEPGAIAAYPQLGTIKRLLYESGAVYASMSGSGSAMYGIFDEEPRADIDFGPVEAQFVTRLT